MKITRQILDKYQAVVQKSAGAELLLRRIGCRTAHCILLQCEDSLLLDILCYIYIDKLLGNSGGDFSQRLLTNNIPDIITLPRGEKVVTEDVEHIIETAHLTPVEFDTKIYLIDNCQTMNESAQNKLLKLLEEPPHSSRFILKCTSKFALLPTVRSRSELLEIQPLSEEFALESLPDDISQELRNLIMATCFGRLDYIEAVLNDESYLQLEDLVFEVFLQMKRSSDMLRFAYRLLKYKDYFETIIFYIECILHDCMVYSTNEMKKIYFAHREEQIKSLSREYNADVCIKLLVAAMRARLRIKNFGNATGIIDELLFSMLEEKTKWQKL